MVNVQSPQFTTNNLMICVNLNDHRDFLLTLGIEKVQIVKRGYK